MRVIASEREKEQESRVSFGCSQPNAELRIDCACAHDEGERGRLGEGLLRTVPNAGDYCVCSYSFAESPGRWRRRVGAAGEASAGRMSRDPGGGSFRLAPLSDLPLSLLRQCCADGKFHPRGEDDAINLRFLGALSFLGRHCTNAHAHNHFQSLKPCSATKNDDDSTKIEIC